MIFRFPFPASPFFCITPSPTFPFDWLFLWILVVLKQQSPALLGLDSSFAPVFARNWLA
jgi:hypothetical protein